MHQFRHNLKTHNFPSKCRNPSHITYFELCVFYYLKMCFSFKTISAFLMKTKPPYFRSPPPPPLPSLSSWFDADRRSHCTAPAAPAVPTAVRLLSPRCSLLLLPAPIPNAATTMTGIAAASFFSNACRFGGCGLHFDSLAELIVHIEDNHIGKSRRVMSAAVSNGRGLVLAGVAKSAS